MNLYFYLTLVGIAYYAYFSFFDRRKPLPPGPPRLPIIGNLHQSPKQNPWRTYQEWTKSYGAVFSLKLGGQTVIVLGTAKSATDLLDKRGNIYSDRPRLVMGGECLSKGFRFLLMPYGPQYRLHQRVQASYLNPRMSQTYRPLQDLESRQLMHEMLTTDDFPTHFQRYSSSLIFSLAYGKRMARGDEPEVVGVREVVTRAILALQVGTWAVDALPFLNYLPNFLAPWKRLADDWHAREKKLWTDNIVGAQKTASWNWAKQAASMNEAKAMSFTQQAYDLGTMYEAGTDTTTMALEVFVLAAIKYPAFVRKAQEELEAVVGSSMLPSFDHRPQLPYIEAVIKEVLRWRPVTAGGVPHATSEEDEYLGYRIPKGAIVIGNHWSIHLDEEIFEKPYDFDPDRWIKNPELPLHPFGFGRRICTGQHIARNSLYINIARLLWGFDITSAKDEGGKEIEIDPMAFTQGFNSRPQPFKASFTVRDEKRRTVIETAWEKVEKDVDIILQQIASSKYDDYPGFASP